MGLFVSTVSADVRIEDLGILLVHPTANVDMSNFTGEELARSVDLEYAIRNNLLTWSETSGGVLRPATDYERDYWDVQGESSGAGNPDYQATVEGLVRVRRMLFYPTIQNTANVTLTLTVASNLNQVFNGTTAGQIVRLPDARTLIKGWRYEIANNASAVIAVQNGDGTALITCDSNALAYLELIDNSTEKGVWMAWQVLTSTIASGILNYKVTSSTTFSTTSVTDVLVTSMALTPIAGTYGIWASADVTIVQNNAIVNASVYKAGSQVVDSERSAQGSSSNFQTQSSLVTTTSVDGTQVVDLRVRVSTGQLDVMGRTLLLVRLGPQS